ncbi:MAG: hypothetical protein WAQ75_11020 [Propionicimonas sp.]
MTAQREVPRVAADDLASELELVREARIDDLLGGDRRQPREASGVHFANGHLHVVFDNTAEILRLRPDWDSAGEAPVLMDSQARGGYEDITYQPDAARWYCLIEASQTPAGTYQPGIDEFDASFRLLGSHWLEYQVKRENKGIEGLSTLRHHGEDYLLGLCEGNACKSGSAGREPGQGRLQAFRRAGDRWEHAGTIRLPRAVQFADYAGLDVSNHTMSVVSQVSSALWIGRLKPEPRDLGDLFEDDGRTYLFPRNRTGRIVYCNIEGVTWLPDGTLVVVSDRCKPDQQSARCRHKDQSIHLFRLPTSLV